MPYSIMGTLPLTWEKVLLGNFDKNVRGNTPTCVGKRVYGVLCCEERKEHSHLRGKKDSVFMRLSEVFAVICMKNFYKNLVLFLPAAMFALSYHKAYSFRFLCKEFCSFIDFLYHCYISCKASANYLQQYVHPYSMG